MDPTQYEMAADAWRVAITLAHNICTQESDRENDNDGPCAAIEMAGRCAKRIKGYIAPSPKDLKEMMIEAGALVINDGSWDTANTTPQRCASRAAGATYAGGDGSHFSSTKGTHESH